MEFSNKGKAIKGVEVRDNTMVIWGDESPRAFNFAVKPFVEISEGANNTKLNFNENVLLAWFNQNNEINIATETEIFTYLNDKQKKVILKEQIDKIEISKGNYIAVLSGDYIFTTYDGGEHWDKKMMKEPILLHQISENGDLLVFTSKKNID